MTHKQLLAALAVASISAFTACRSADKDDRPTIKVAAAADLASAFTEIGAAFEKETGTRVVFTFGSTGLLSKQILEGAPFDVFAAANVSFVDEVTQGGKCDKETKALYGRGRLAVWSKKGDAPKTLEDLKDPRYQKIAIANPEHAPYGKAAKEALASAGVWDAVASRVVFGENVQQTLQFAQTENADVAIVALSLAIVSEGSYFVIDEGAHKPLDQAMVVCADGKKRERAASFEAFVNSEKGREIMKRYGFLLPGEKTAAN